ncbi:MAG: hypothetical protein JW816_00065 [Candidatus Buchananbacteria bacterium]|nr:hypothetical protein [Candidatus Buchananbacteria bacterium]
MGIKHKKLEITISIIIFIFITLTSILIQVFSEAINKRQNDILTKRLQENSLISKEARDSAMVGQDIYMFMNSKDAQEQNHFRENVMESLDNIIESAKVVLELDYEIIALKNEPTLTFLNLDINSLEKLKNWLYTIQIISIFLIAFLYYYSFLKIGKKYITKIENENKELKEKLQEIAKIK